MIKYRQLHIDSNHGFIRLDDGKFLAINEKDISVIDLFIIIERSADQHSNLLTATMV